MSHRTLGPAQQRAYHIIFGTEPGLPRIFDLLLIALIVSSVTVILMDSVSAIHASHGPLLLRIEWVFTGIFTVEYLLRLWCSPNRSQYARSFYGVIDLLAILPTYIAFFFPAAAPLLLIRLVRIWRIFRLLRLLRLVSESTVLLRALRRSRRKIFLFFIMMLMIATIFGCLLYIVDGPEHGFTSIPTSIYWAIVSITTVGFGDLVPVTPLGRTIAAVGVLMGYAIIALPTGIVTAELAHEMGRARDRRICTNCEHTGHDSDSNYCDRCGTALPEPQ